MGTGDRRDCRGVEYQEDEDAPGPVQCRGSPNLAQPRTDKEALKEIVDDPDPEVRGIVQQRLAKECSIN